jgi:uncharacterized membrane protein YidH (DUF202 family)
MNEGSQDISLSTNVATIMSLLDRVVTLQEAGAELSRERAATGATLLEQVAATSDHTRRQTEMAEQRTALAREHTTLSKLGNELSGVRTDLARERTGLSAERTTLARTRTGMSQRRTVLASDRNHLATTRTLLSRLRTELARGRTALALIRTGLAFLTLGVGLFRLFGPSLWSLFDAALVLGSLVMTMAGIRSYARVLRTQRKLDEALESSG